MLRLERNFSYSLCHAQHTLMSSLEVINATVVNALGTIIDQKDVEIAALREVCNHNAETIKQLKHETEMANNAQEHWRKCCHISNEEFDLANAKNQHLITTIEKLEDVIDGLNQNVDELNKKLAASQKKAAAKKKAK
jgi:beta-phosphoglucomutase-like phosphatase (HAD superfamily)